MELLQKSLDEALVSVSQQVVLESLIRKKLKAQSAKVPKSLSARLAKHLLSGTSDAFTFGRKSSKNKNIVLNFTEADIAEIQKGIERFAGELPKVVPRIAKQLSDSVLKRLKAGWSREYVLQKKDLSTFRRRLEKRWGEPLGKLRMLLTIAREWAGYTYARDMSGTKHADRHFREILNRLLARGLQVTDEIICLLENGFADGSMARWRTLHEISVVASVISQHGPHIADRYLAHQAIESKRAMDRFLTCYARLGYKPLSARQEGKITKAYDMAIAKYGKSFRSDYGWAAFHLNKENPRLWTSSLRRGAGKCAHIIRWATTTCMPA